ncbi:MAG TPA: Cof-type HAD-IIB family hydrolase, partial [Firmicutes bacterium]|nr:Cof-type HAD-IIB family hydrolase [Bacillota bacterium]
GDLSRFIDGEVTKLLLIGSEKKFRAFRARLEKILGRKVNLVQSEETYLEILPVGVSKGEAL